MFYKKMMFTDIAGKLLSNSANIEESDENTISTIAQQTLNQIFEDARDRSAVKYDKEPTIEIMQNIVELGREYVKYIGNLLKQKCSGSFFRDAIETFLKSYGENDVMLLIENGFIVYEESDDEDMSLFLYACERNMKHFARYCISQMDDPFNGKLNLEFLYNSDDIELLLFILKLKVDIPQIMYKEMIFKAVDCDLIQDLFKYADRHNCMSDEIRATMLTAICNYDKSFNDEQEKMITSELDEFYLRILFLHSCSMGYTTHINYIIDHFPNFNIDCTDYNNKTALMLLLKSGLKKPDIEKFIKRGANVNHQDDQGCSVLMCAMYGSDVSVVEILIKSGANVNHQDNQGCSVLMCAVYGSKLAVIKKLIELGANVNLQDRKGRTVMHNLTIYTDYEIIRTLISSGADLSIRDRKRRTALEYLREEHRYSAANVIEHPELTDDEIEELNDEEEDVEFFYIDSDDWNPNLLDSD